MRIAVVDIGTNSTRLLVADVTDGRVEEVERHTNITRLGEGVDRDGRLREAAMLRVAGICAGYRAVIDGLSVDRSVAVLTSAVRDAANGAQFQQNLCDLFGFDARTIPGEREARLTYLGATSWRRHDEPLLVLDIGGGSTEFVVGVGEAVDFHVSTQIGSVRHTERHLGSDPPAPGELKSCSEETRAEIERALPPEVRRRVSDGIAVAGTPTSFAAVDQRLEPYDRKKVHGYRLGLEACERVLSGLAALPIRQRRQVPGLHPDRAATIVAGGIILLETMKTLGLDPIEVSECGILEGTALEAAGARSLPKQSSKQNPRPPA